MSSITLVLCLVAVLPLVLFAAWLWIGIAQAVYDLETFDEFASLHFEK